MIIGDNGASAEGSLQGTFNEMLILGGCGHLETPELLIRWSIAETLAHAGHTVIEAEDGATAIRALKSAAEAIDAVVLDYRLPDSNDLTLVATVRRLAPESAVVLMTAFGTPEIAKGALDLGVHQVLHKPFEMHDLKSLLEEACSAGNL